MGWLIKAMNFIIVLLKKWLDDNDIKIYSTYNEGISVISERFIRTPKNKINKHMAAMSKKFYFGVLKDIVDKYNNTYYRTIKMRPIDVKSDSYAKYNVDSNDKDPKFKISDHVRISEYKNIFDKGCSSLVRTSFCHGLMLLVILMVKKLLELFMKRNCKRLIKKNLE